MKNLNLINSKILVLIILIASCCDEKNPVDPMIGYPKTLRPITTTGDNVLACRVNGKLRESYVGLNLSGYNSFSLGYDSVSTMFGVNSNWIISEIFQNITLMSKIRKGELGSYKILNKSGVAIFSSFNPKIELYYLDTAHVNYLNIIKFDTIKKIISATFEFNAISDNMLDTVIISEGRFDGTYSTI